MELIIDVNKAIEEIKKQNAKRVLLQLPDGLKSKAGLIKDQIEKETECKVFIWMGSCFGACDIPPVKEEEFDILIQLGHNEYLR